MTTNDRRWNGSIDRTAEGEPDSPRGIRGWGWRRVLVATWLVLFVTHYVWYVILRLLFDAGAIFVALLVAGLLPLLPLLAVSVKHGRYLAAREPDLEPPIRPVTAVDDPVPPAGERDRGDPEQAVRPAGTPDPDGPEEVEGP